MRNVITVLNPQQQYVKVSLTFITLVQFVACVISDVTSIRDFVLVADSYIQEIYRMDLETGSYSAIPQYSVNTPIGIDYDPLTHTVFYSDVGLHLIKSTDLDGNNEKILKRLNSGKSKDELLINWQKIGTSTL